MARTERTSGKLPQSDPAPAPAAPEPQPDPAAAPPPAPPVELSIDQAAADAALLAEEADRQTKLRKAETRAAEAKAAKEAAEIEARRTAGAADFERLSQECAAFDAETKRLVREHELELKDGLKSRGERRKKLLAAKLKAFNDMNGVVPAPVPEK